jgi:hypothetical protein
MNPIEAKLILANQMIADLARWADDGGQCIEPEYLPEPTYTQPVDVIDVDHVDL